MYTLCGFNSNFNKNRTKTIVGVLAEEFISRGIINFFNFKIEMNLNYDNFSFFFSLVLVCPKL